MQRMKITKAARPPPAARPLYSLALLDLLNLPRRIRATKVRAARSKVHAGVHRKPEAAGAVARRGLHKAEVHDEHVAGGELLRSPGQPAGLRVEAEPGRSQTGALARELNGEQKPFAGGGSPPLTRVTLTE